jgi:hypothetical protein
MIVAAKPLSQPEEKRPKQAKLLGATVQGVGTITSVSAILFDCFVLIEDETGREHHRFVKDLKKDEVTLPAEPQPFHTYNRRIGYGLWSEMMCLESPIQATDLKVA